MPSSSPAATPPTPPTRIRWHIVGLMMALCFISHLNRVSMSVAADERIMKQFGIAPTQMGAVYSAFLLVYTMCMTLGGLFIDRFGPRTALTIMGLGSAVFGALTGVVGFGWLAAAQVLTALIVVRSLMGLFTTPLHPACARAVANWMPSSRLSWANGLVTCAAIAGVSATYPIFGALIDRFDWPLAFLFTAGVTFGLTICWWLYARDRPSQHSGCNDSERQLITGTTNPAAETQIPSEQIGCTSFFSVSLVMLTLSYAAVGYFQYLFFYWIHYYFKEVLVLGTERSRFYAGLPTLALAVGMLLGGWLSDRVRRTTASFWGRALVPGGGLLLGALFLALGLVPREPGWIVAFFTVSMGCVGASESSFWQTAVEIGGRRGGTAAAIINTGGNGVGLLAPLLTPFISDQLGWKWGLGLGGIICFLGALCWCWIDPQKHVRNSAGFHLP